MTPDDLIAKQFFQVIPHAMRAIRTHIRQIAKTELTVPQFRVLALLSQEEYSTNSSVAENMGMSPPCASRMVDCLVKQGLIKRARGTRDRREVCLKLTSKGLMKFNSIKVKAQVRFNERFKKLSTDQKTALKSGFEVLDQIFRE